MLVAYQEVKKVGVIEIGVRAFHPVDEEAETSEDIIFLGALSKSISYKRFRYIDCTSIRN